MAEYDAATQRVAATELEALPTGSVLAGMIEDYGRLRSEVRACRWR